MAWACLFMCEYMHTRPYMYHESQENFKVESWISSDIHRRIVAWPLVLIGLWQKTFNFRLSIFKRMRPPICTSKKNLIRLWFGREFFLILANTKSKKCHIYCRIEVSLVLRRIVDLLHRYPLETLLKISQSVLATLLPVARWFDVTRRLL